MVMAIIPQSLDPVPLVHGGDLAEARRLYPNAPAFVDLSTGINPHCYPLPGLSPDAFTRLPERADIERLLRVGVRGVWRAVGGLRRGRAGDADPAAADRSAGAAGPCRDSVADL